MGSIRLLCAAIFLTAGPVLAAETAPGDVNIEDMKVGMSLTGGAGDAAEGANTFKDRKMGNCLACHTTKAMSKELFHGNVGPSLDGVADRYEPEQLRAILVNSKAVFGPDTVMPGFYSLDVGEGVSEEFQGKTILTAAQVEDIVAFLSTLKE